jgi:hypothetical protein
MWILRMTDEQLCEKLPLSPIYAIILRLVRRSISMSSSPSLTHLTATMIKE